MVLVRAVVLLAPVATLSVAGCTAAPVPQPPVAPSSPVAAPTAPSTAAQVHTEQESIFLAALLAQGYATGSDAADLDRARTVCSALANGASFERVVDAIETSGHSRKTAQGFAIASIVGLCPEQSADIPTEWT